jgi:hypothetical protein
MLAFFAWAIAAFFIRPNDNVLFSIYLGVWVATGVWIWGRGVWHYVRLLENTLITEKESLQ